jgi:phosphoribosyl-ATP pyrophosphohydrolase
MDEELTDPVRESMEEDFRLLYGVYVRLGSEACASATSTTRHRLLRVRAGDTSVILECTAKLLEEEHEVRLVLAGQHAHEGQTRRQTMINELMQMLYWPLVLAVGRGVQADEVEFARFFLGGMRLQEPGKAAFASTGRAEAAILRRTLFVAGRLLYCYNKTWSSEAIDPHEIVMADMAQMVAKGYWPPA